MLARVGFDEQQIKELVDISKDKATSEKLKLTTQEAIDAKVFNRCCLKLLRKYLNLWSYYFAIHETMFKVMLLDE